MSRAGVKLWAVQAMLVVADFTRFISGIHANCPHRDAQRLLAENLWEEHGQGDRDRDHLSLSRRLARSLGATDDEMDRAEPLPETAAYINHCLEVTRTGSFVEGMTAIGVGIESFIPAFFGAMAEALRRNYGLTAADVEFLSVHVMEDADHARRSMELLEKYADSQEARSSAIRALEEVVLVKQAFAASLFARCSSASE
jgi:pyrroloquinoline quinone (PQQ) biosynthesis protein C